MIDSSVAAVLDAVPHPVWVVDLNAAPIFFNAAAAKFLGYTPAELVAGAWAYGIHPDDRDRLDRAWADARQRHSPFTGDYRLCRSDGTLRRHTVHGRPVKGTDGAVVTWVVTATDADDCHRGLEAEARLAAVVESSGDAITSCAADGTVLTWNPAAERLFGYTAAEITGRSVYRLAPADRQGEAREAVGRVLRGEPVATYETVRQGCDGRKVSVAVTPSPVRGPGGEVVGFSAVYRDIGPRKALEAQYLQAQKMQAVGRLASGVAHDFNNLLTVINGYSEVALRNLPTGDGVRELVEEVRRAGQRAAGLTRQLLAFSRKQVLHPRVFDLGLLVTDLASMLRRILGEDIRLHVQHGPGLATVLADPGQLEQVVLNLAVNARDAMLGGGEVIIHVRNTALDGERFDDSGEVRPGQYVVLGVSDTGTGMTDEVKGRAFEPFFTTKEPGKGTGLGLATVYGIVRQSGGHVRIETSVGKGTTFWIYLPCAGVPEAPAEQFVDCPRGGRETVLLVEDDEAVRSLALRVLQDAGYVVLDAEDAAQAVRAVESYGTRVDVLLTDVVLPGIGGRELADRLAEGQPGLRVLYMSGHLGEVVLTADDEPNCAAFLSKPFTPAELAKKVRDVLDHSRA